MRPIGSPATNSHIIDHYNEIMSPYSGYLIKTAYEEICHIIRNGFIHTLGV